MSAGISDAIEELILSYQELNPPHVDELDEEPSPLEFMRYVAQNKPFVIRKGASEWKACQEWTDPKYLSEIMRGQKVKVAMTPFGNADSPLESKEGLIFVKPYEEELPFEDVWITIKKEQFGLYNPGTHNYVSYAQTQNDNLRNEYESLFSDVLPSIPFARIALQKEPEAINFWMGNSFSTTALHRDPYENIYVQVMGRKHFVLLPPVEAACVNEQNLPAATYIPFKDDEQHRRILQNTDVPTYPLGPKLDEPPSTVPFATWDPDNPDIRPTQYSHLSRPYRVILDPGDMLYLPALWYHKVKPACIESPIISVNYW